MEDIASSAVTSVAAEDIDSTFKSDSIGTIGESAIQVVDNG